LEDNDTDAALVNKVDVTQSSNYVQNTTQNMNEQTNVISKNSKQDTLKAATEQKTDPDIRLGNSEIHPGVDKTFLALLDSDATGSATLKIDTTTIAKNISIEDGQVLYTYTIPSTYNHEYYTLYLEYSGDEKYNAKTVNATLTLTPVGGKVNATMSMNNITAKYSKTATLKVSLNKNATGNVTFSMDNKNITTVKVTKGVATASYKIVDVPSNKTIIATYNGDFQYTKTTVNCTLKINPLNSKTTTKNITSKAGNTTLFTATVNDENNDTVENMVVEFRLNGNLIGSNTTNNKGVVNLYYVIPSTLYTQTNNITVRANKTVTVAASTANATLTLKQLKTTTSVPSISAIPSKTVVITATVSDEFKNPVTKGSVTFKNGTKVLDTVNVSDGHAQMTYTSNYETGNTTITAIYSGDWKYANSNGNGLLRINRVKTTTLSSAVDAKPNSEVTLSATIRDQNQNPAMDGQVRFTVNNKVVGTANVAQGSASLKYSLKNLTVGNYRINTEYLGSKIYLKSSSNNTLTVKRYETTVKGNSINAVVGSSTDLTVTVTDEERYKVDQGSVKFYVNTEYIGEAKVSDGTATIKYNVNSKYDGKIIRFYATYQQNALYESSTCSNTITVAHQKCVYVSTSGSDSNLGDRLHPFKTLTYAINHTTLFGTIKIREGVYSASNITINNSITIIGAGKNNTFIDGLNNGKCIFNITKRNVAVTIKGVTIRNGKSNSNYSAGAIVSSGKLNIIFTRFANNTGAGNFSGGAIYSNGILNLTNCEFTGNKVTNVNSQGGAIRSYNNTTYITSCNFNHNKVTGNNSTGGSCIYSESGDLILNRTTIVNNTATGKFVTGGVIRSAYGAVVIDGCAFKNNTITATNYAVGGAIGSLSSGLYINNTVINTMKIKATNTAGGGAVYVETAACEILNSKMYSNNMSAANTYGGILYGYYSMAIIEKSSMYTNYMNASAAASGGVIYAYNGNMTVESTNFTKNKVDAKNMALAGAIYSYSDVKISNSNFVKNRINATSLGGGAIANMGKLQVTNTNFIDNYAYNCGNAITSTTSATNTVNGNYWGSSKPDWKKLLYSITQPSKYSTTKIKN
jgi:hypothetical protein